MMDHLCFLADVHQFLQNVSDQRMSQMHMHAKIIKPNQIKHVLLAVAQSWSLPRVKARLLGLGSGMSGMAR